MGAESLKARTFTEFISAAAPLAGYKDVEQFYKMSNPMEYFSGNETPCLILNALDDFVCVKENIRKDLVESSVGNYVLVVTMYGSHCAYVEGALAGGNYMWRKALD